MRPDGSTGAIDNRPFYLARLAAGTLYQAAFAHEMELMGFPIERTHEKRRNTFEVVGVPGSLVSELSKRRTEIERVLNMIGDHSPKAAAAAALLTRDAKQDIPYETLFAMWRAVAREHNFIRTDVETLSRAGNLLPKDSDQQAAMKAATTIALSRLSREESHFTLNQIVRAFGEEAIGRGISASIVRDAAMQAVQADGELIYVGDRRGERRYTTRELWDLEKALLLGATELQYKNQHPVDAESLARAIDKVETEATQVAWEKNPHAVRFVFSEEHRKALAHITRESGDIAVLSGLAGVGKTLCLAAARLAWQEEGFVVVGTAVAGKAAGLLREETGIPSMTVEKLTLLIKSGQSPLTARSILVVDEASMVSTHQMATIVSAAQSSASKLVLVGDPKQLQAIDAGGSLCAIEQRIGSTTLKTIVRQEIDRADKSPYWRRQVVKDFADGNAGDALNALNDRGALHIENGGRSGAMKALVQVWQERGIKNPRENLIFAGLRDEVRELNRLAQDARRSAGQLGFRSVHVGDVEICEKDRIIVTRRDARRSVENGDLGTVVAIERAANTLSVKLDRGLVVSIDYKNFEHLALGYAMTGHKAQGQTTKNSFVLCGGSMADREMAYVLASRARQETHFFSERIMAWDSDKGAMVDKTLPELGRQLSQSRQATLAHDVALDQATRNPVEQQESLGKAANQNLIPER